MTPGGRHGHGAIEFRCADVGVVCRHVTRRDTVEELLAAVRDHARQAHGVDLNETLVDYARSKATAGGPERPDVG